MERREICINFIKGLCKDGINCLFAHVLVPDREMFLKTHEERVKENNSNSNSKTHMDNNKPSQIFTLFEPSVGSRRWMTSCQDCEKGHSFDYNIVKGSLESLYCNKCIDKYYTQKKVDENFM